MSNGSLLPGVPRVFRAPRVPRPRRTGAALAAALVLLAGAVGCSGGGSGADKEGNGKGSPSPSGATSRGRPGGKPLAGKVVAIDPGHNPHNRDHTGRIARLVDIGTDKKECDTTGTSTNGGYAEADFTLDVSRRLVRLLEADGAKVVLTQNGDRSYGPCVDERAEIGNKAHADAAVSVHADGAPTGARGFHVIAPASVKGGDADTSAIARPSRRLATGLIDRFARATGSRRSTYLGHGTGLMVRDDLGGLNLSRVPKVFIECGNMRDSKDAAQVTDPKWRQRAAAGIAQGITDFLRD